MPISTNHSRHSLERWNLLSHCENILSNKLHSYFSVLCALNLRTFSANKWQIGWWKIWRIRRRSGLKMLGNSWRIISCYKNVTVISQVCCLNWMRWSSNQVSWFHTIHELRLSYFEKLCTNYIILRWESGLKFPPFEFQWKNQWFRQINQRRFNNLKLPRMVQSVDRYNLDNGNLI